MEKAHNGLHFVLQEATSDRDITALGSNCPRSKKELPKDNREDFCFRYLRKCCFLNYCSFQVSNVLPGRIDFSSLRTNRIVHC